MKAERKITVHVPGELLASAQRETGAGITETVRQGLRLVAAANSYRELRKLRGRIRVALDLSELRDDRR